MSCQQGEKETRWHMNVCSFIRDSCWLHWQAFVPFDHRHRHFASCDVKRKSKTQRERERPAERRKRRNLEERMSGSSLHSTDANGRRFERNEFVINFWQRYARSAENHAGGSMDKSESLSWRNVSISLSGSLARSRQSNEKAPLHTLVSPTTRERENIQRIGACNQCFLKLKLDSRRHKTEERNH